MNNKDRIFLNTREAAQKLGCAEKTVRRLVRNGQLPGKKLGRRYYVREDGLETLGQRSHS